mmetsp:Transcript_89496/g.278515  ORF Transcript_89496/g.278515 Transcript_89496/m.278515 type:complete len:217 (-) Transcript_89496:63-713(-)
MGNAGSYAVNDRSSLIRGLGASIRDHMRPTRAMLAEAWAMQGKGQDGLLRREDLPKLMVDLLDVQIRTAQQEASAVKMDMARQQAWMEKEARTSRSEVLYASRAAESQQVGRDALNRASALCMGSAAGPVMAGMMAGYADIPVTCLTKMKADSELLEVRAELLMRQVGDHNGLISPDEFATHYLEFFDSAHRVLGDGTAVSPDGFQPKDNNECILQ